MSPSPLAGFSARSGRIPAGLRTSPGRVPLDGFGDIWTPHVVLGPMARSSQDAGLLLAAMSGVSDISATSIDEDPSVFLKLAEVDLSNVRIAWNSDVGGLPVSQEVRDGFARNYLLPTGKALRANAANKARSMRGIIGSTLVLAAVVIIYYRNEFF